MDTLIWIITIITVFGLHSEVISAANVMVNPVEVKLVGNGDTSKRGRVDILYMGAWGTLCVRDMDKNVAAVICKTLGERRGLARPADGKRFRADGLHTPFWVVNGCNGTEENLAECGYLDMRRNVECEEVYDHAIAGVDCDPDPDPGFQVRLTNGGSRSSGIVEMYRKGRWGTICGKRWSTKEAQVVCKQLGFQIDRVMPLTVSGNFSKYASANRPLTLSGLECVGDETTMRNCVHRPWNDLPCEWGGRGAVDCETDIFPVTVRLVGGKNNNGGWVQVRLLGRWGNLASSGWSSLEATVVCRKLGHWWGSNVNKEFDRNIVTSGSWFSDIKCTGEEKDLYACQHSGWTFSESTNKPLAIASCYNDSPRPPLPVITGNSDDLLSNMSVSLNCWANADGLVTLRWVCQGRDYVTRGPLTGRRISLPLEINHLTSKHNNLDCKCQLVGGRGWSVSSSRELRVKYEPATISLTQMNVVKPGEIFGLECQSGLAFPAVTLKWLNGTQQVNSTGIHYTKTFPYGVRTFQRWFFRAERHMSGQVISCVAESPLTNLTTFDSVVLVVGTDIHYQGVMALAPTHFWKNTPASILTFLKATFGAVFDNQST